MSQAEYYVPDMRWNAGGTPSHARPAGRSRARTPAAGGTPSPGGMIETAENLGREYGISSPGAGRVGRPVARARRRGHRGGPLRRRDHPGGGPRSARATRSSSRATSIRDPAPRWRAGPAQAHPGQAPLPDATVTAGNSSGQNDAAAVAIVTTPSEGRGARAAPARPAGQLVARRGRAAAGWGSVRCRQPSALWDAPGSRGRTSTSSSSTRRSPPRCWPASAAGVCPTPTSSGSTSTARASRSATRSGRPAAASWPTSCARWIGARPATAWRRCASAAGRASRRSSSGWC